MVHQLRDLHYKLKCSTLDTRCVPKTYGRLHKNGTLRVQCVLYIFYCYVYLALVYYFVRTHRARCVLILPDVCPQYTPDPDSYHTHRVSQYTPDVTPSVSLQIPHHLPLSNFLYV
jgi:hypothetical protein